MKTCEVALSYGDGQHSLQLKHCTAQHKMSSEYANCGTKFIFVLLAVWNK